jgi:alpha-mannosidase
MKDLRRRAINAFERIEQRIERLARFIDVLNQPITGWMYREGRHLAPGKYDVDGKWKPYTPDLSWGGEDRTAWFRSDVEIPSSMHEKEITLRLAPGGEGILRVNGEAVYGLDHNHREYCLTPRAARGDKYVVELECYVRDAPDDALRNNIRTIHRFDTAELAVKDARLEEFYYDLCAALDAAIAFQDHNAEMSARLTRRLQNALAEMDLTEEADQLDQQEAVAARDRFRTCLEGENYHRAPGTMHLVAHSHLDLVYVWPYRESVRKNMRTHLIAERMMQQYPHYVFTQSQAKLFHDLKVHHPEVFARVKERVEEGRLEPVGDMWVEADGHIPSGEAWIRHILYGKQFFKNELGCSSSICWMSDIFGVPASIPQILTLCGYEIFYTTKQSVWQDTNEFPYHTFHWEGIDGSRVIAHIPPTHFVGHMDPAMMLKHWDDYREKQEAPNVLYTYGYGDGGGGPTEKMLAYGDRLSRMGGFPGLQWSSPGTFVRELTASATDLPVWADELYLEAHRGTQTTKGSLKFKNRRAEATLRSAEILSTVASWRGEPLRNRRKLESSWKTLLESQFHDAVTGTHCEEAGRETELAYDAVLRDTRDLVRSACRRIAAEGKPGMRTLFNLTGAVDEGHVVWTHEGSVSLYCDGDPVPTQRLADGNLLSYVKDLPLLGHKRMSVKELTPDSRAPFTTGPDALESPFYALRFNDQGWIESIYDKQEKRELLTGPGNRLRMYEDTPGRFEAWDISRDYASLPVNAIEFLDLVDGDHGPLVAEKIARWQVGSSTVRQHIRLYAHSRRIDFHTHVDWQEDRKLLRVSFPLAIHAGQATYEIAYGVIRRATRPLTSFEQAKFEVPFHRWFDLSEHGYGISLLNDGKYGGCVHENVASLSLLKAPRFPDPSSDRGEHEFTYSLFPHPGDWQSGGTWQQAVLLNCPLELAEGEADPAEYLRVSRAGVAVETMKEAEDGDGWILRLVDYFGQRGDVSVTLPVAVRTVHPCTPLEDAGDAPLDTDGSGFSFQLRPFGIHTFRIRNS